MGEKLISPPCPSLQRNQWLASYEQDYNHNMGFKAGSQQVQSSAFFILHQNTRSINMVSNGLS